VYAVEGFALISRSLLTNDKRRVLIGVLLTHQLGNEAIFPGEREG